MIKNDHNSIRNIVPDGDHQIEDIHDFIRICEIARYKGIPLEKEWMDIQNMILTRRWIIHRSVPKLDKGMLLSKLYAKDKKVIIFTMDIESCERIYDEFKRSVKNTFIIHSKRNDNNEQINNFRRVDSGVLIGARMLDEGLDFPDAEVGINISSSKTKLQLIQRMGRILRKKDGKKAIFHHFISVPEKEDMISEEDDLNLLDDLSWVVDVAGKMRLKMDVVEVDEYIKDVRRSGERRISEKWKNNRLKELPGYGSFNMKNILSTFSYETLQRLIMNIYKLPEGIISDDEWYDLVKKASENDKETRVDVVGSWWILIIGRRDPDTIINIFRSYLNQNK